MKNTESICAEIQSETYQLIKHSNTIDEEELLSTIKSRFYITDDILIEKNVQIALLAHEVAARWPLEIYKTNPASDAAQLTRSYLNNEIPNASDDLRFHVLNELMRRWLY